MYTKLLIFMLVKDRDPGKTGMLLSRFQQIVRTIVVLVEALTATALTELLGTDTGEVQQISQSLGSVLRYSESNDIPIRLFHPSFRDFLLDRRRYDDPRFAITGIDTHCNLTISCLHLMSRKFKQDICSLRLPGSLTGEINLGVIQSYLPSEIQYACCYWFEHLRQSGVRPIQGEPLHDKLHDFFNEHLLHWLEALSLIGCLHDGAVVIRALDSLLSVCKPQWFLCHKFRWGDVIQASQLKCENQAPPVGYPGLLTPRLVRSC